MILSGLDEKKMITGINIVQASPSISHLFFADDSLLFMKANKEEMKAISKALWLYSKLSGQEINFSK